MCARCWSRCKLRNSIRLDKATQALAGGWKPEIGWWIGEGKGGAIQAICAVLGFIWRGELAGKGDIGPSPTAV